MRRTRRRVLAAAALPVGLAGCLRVDGVDYPDETDDATEPPTGGEDGSGDDDGDGAEGDEDDEPVPNADLADATRRVVDDAVWFASAYGNAVETYRDATSDVVTAVEAVRGRVREPTDPTTAMARRLEAAGYAAGERAAAALEPHFYPEGLLRERTDRHVPALVRSARRNDADRFVEELDRMRASFKRIQTPLYVGGTFSRDPIHNRLLERLAPDAAGSVLVELAVPERRGFATVAHEPYDGDGFGPRFTEGTSTEDAFTEIRRRALRERLGPVVRPAGRNEELLASFSARPDPVGRRANAFDGSPGDLDGTAVHVQAYDDSGAASDRLAAVLEAGSTEGTESIRPGVGREWYRYYHRAARSDRTDLDEFAGVQYGYVIQAGEFVLATGFSGDAWEERVRWQGALTDAWVSG